VEEGVPRSMHAARRSASSASFAGGHVDPVKARTSRTKRSNFGGVGRSKTSFATRVASDSRFSRSMRRSCNACVPSVPVGGKRKERKKKKRKRNNKEKKEKKHRAKQTKKRCMKCTCHDQSVKCVQKVHGNCTNSSQASELHQHKTDCRILVRHHIGGPMQNAFERPKTK
jgi:hypothetical protein